jgi:hypothetical protein
VQCLDAGGDDFLSKPYNRIILQAKIKSFNRMREMHSTMLAQRNQIVQYNRFTKREYMQRLDHVFRSKDFVNIEFEDNTLRKSNANPNLFGIQIKQNYRSNNYGDQGYLFLLIDFSVRNEPSIHVRTWQPEKDPDGRIYGLEDF